MLLCNPRLSNNEPPISSRDRLAFSKSMMRKFLRDSVDRESIVASPWTVKSNLAKLYGLETEMPDNVREKIEDCRKGEAEKRKKACALIYCQFKLSRSGYRYGKKKMALPVRNRRKLWKRKVRLIYYERPIPTSTTAADIAQSQAPSIPDIEIKKKKAIKYPIEDLDVERTDKERKQGAKRRPLPQGEVPFGKDFESFFMSWCYLQTFG